MNQKSVAVDFVLLPSKKLAKTAYTKSEELYGSGSLFVLKDGERFAHCTLYMMQLNIESINSARMKIETVTDSLTAVNLKAIGTHQNRGYFSVNYERSSEVLRIQMAVVNAINPMRAGLRANDIELMKVIHGPELENLKQYGFRGVGSQYSPHITLTRFDDDSERSTNIILSNFDGEFDRIGLFELGENGTCVRKLFEVPLS